MLDELKKSSLVPSNPTSSRKTIPLIYPEIFSRYTDYHYSNAEQYPSTPMRFETFHDTLPHFQTLDLFEDGEVESLVADTLECRVSFSMFRILEYRPLSLKNFFILQQIDTPLVLKQSRSKFRPAFVEPFNRLVGMLSRHGKHPRVRLLMISSYRNLVNEFFFPKLLSSQPVSGPLLSRLLCLDPITFRRSADEDEVDPYTHPVTFWGDLAELRSRYGDSYERGELDLAWDRRIYSKLFSLLYKFTPIFSMKTRKVDKLRFKHSRGKTGKYSVEWKYIPRYKRLDVVLRWLVDDVRFQKGNTFHTQLLKSLRVLMSNPSEHLIVRNRNYVHKNVYARYKSTLLRTLKQVH